MSVVNFGIYYFLRLDRLAYYAIHTIHILVLLQINIYLQYPLHFALVCCSFELLNLHVLYVNRYAQPENVFENLSSGSRTGSASLEETTGTHESELRHLNSGPSATRASVSLESNMFESNISWTFSNTLKIPGSELIQIPQEPDPFRGQADSYVSTSSWTISGPNWPISVSVV